MNTELIEKLDDQAWEYAVDNSNGLYNDGRLSQRKREKFAELIIRECSNFMDNVYQYDAPNGSEYPPVEVLLKHFGLNDD